MNEPKYIYHPELNVIEIRYPWEPTPGSTTTFMLNPQSTSGSTYLRPKQSNRYRYKGKFIARSALNFHEVKVERIPK